MQLQLYRFQITLKCFDVRTANITAVKVATATASNTAVTTAIKFYRYALFWGKVFITTFNLKNDHLREFLTRFQNI